MKTRTSEVVNSTHTQPSQHAGFCAEVSFGACLFILAFLGESMMKVALVLSYFVRCHRNGQSSVRVTFKLLSGEHVRYRSIIHQLNTLYVITQNPSHECAHADAMEHDLSCAFRARASRRERSGARDGKLWAK